MKVKVESENRKSVANGKSPAEGGWATKRIGKGGIPSAEKGCLQTCYIGSLIALGSFEQVELHALAFVQSAVAVLLDGGEVHENIFATRPLNETIALSTIKPFHCSLLSHKQLLSPQIEVGFSRRGMARARGCVGA